MFSQACVKNSVDRGEVYTPGADTPPPPKADGYYSGQYASYWNAFLFLYNVCTAVSHVCRSVCFATFQPTICRNPACANRSRFMLDVNKSKFVDFQKVRIQETQSELPRGSIPRRYVSTLPVLNRNIFYTNLSRGHWSL